MFLLVIILLFHSFLSVAQQEKHSLHFKFTALSKADTFPEFSAVAVADGRQIKHYSNEDQSWVRSSLTEDDWTKSPAEPPDSRDWFIHQIRTLSDCTQCSGAFNASLINYQTCCEDFCTVLNTVYIHLMNMDLMERILWPLILTICSGLIKTPKAKETKREWDKRNEHLHHYLQTCLNWISTFNNTKKTPPDVRVFARSAPDDQCKLNLTCLTTGFYPRAVRMNIRLYRLIIKDQTSSGIRPNDDGSFQMRTSVEIDRKHKEFYDCFVNHSSLAEPTVIEWVSQWALKVVLITVPIVLVLIVICVCIYKKRRLHGEL
uniref:Immunoglobulin C1-set domain-containing protein n=1 Tax=Sinocyclocheilus rhinocerous TaxID=307959 RepID=A0A673ISS2_9TELE